MLGILGCAKIELFQAYISTLVFNFLQCTFTQCELQMYFGDITIATQLHCKSVEHTVMLYYPFTYSDIKTHFGFNWFKYHFEWVRAALGI